MTATPPESESIDQRNEPATQATSATSATPHASGSTGAATAAAPAASAAASASSTLRRVSIASLLALIALSVAWELWLAPLRPGGSWLVLKALLLLLPLRGVLRGNLYTLQWSSMFILLFLAEGVVRGMTDTGPSVPLAWIETALSAVFFFATVFYLRPFKRAAKARGQQAPATRQPQ
ncbi:membrane protein [Pandoraea iniqua]|uniref:DUF2069 domain-containing protein n=1 Tax=Pandoraea iniqua TaxID=2508288 RepID=UPI00123FDD9E|nr:membrane protein [Pandoraea iniqua]